MAEAVLFCIAKGVLSSIASEIAKPGGTYASQMLQLLCCAEGELHSLKDTVEAIKRGLLDAEKQQWHNDGVKFWLKRLKDVLYDAEDLFDDISTEDLRRQAMAGNKMMKEVRLFFSESNQLAHGFNVAVKIRQLRKKLDLIDSDNKFTFEPRLTEETMAIGKRKKPQFHAPDTDIIGRKEEKERIKHLLFDSSSSDTVSFVSILGKGGLGKTALARLVYNDVEVEGHFGLKMWVCVSDVFDVDLIIKEILKSAKGNCRGNDDETKKLLEDVENKPIDQMRTLLSELLGMKKFLLVLDDMWNEVRLKWLELGAWLEGGVRGSKILVTTRNRGVAKVVDKDSPIFYLEGLSGDMSWDLFMEAAFGNRQTPVDQRLEEMGRAIVGKCAGVPLAIRTVGTLLYGKNEDEWLRYNVLDLPEIPEVDGADNGIVQYLQFSYDHLSSWLKQCFAYCSLFPKDYVYRKDVITRLWMAQGFIESHDVEDNLEERAGKYLSNLLDRSFLDAETIGDEGEVLTFKMHDLMHDLARKVAGAECKIVNFDKGGTGGEIRHASIISHVFPQEKLVSFLEKSKLRTFLHLGGDGLREESSALDCDKVFSWFRQCRVLGFLGKTYIPLSPSSFGKLKHLRFVAFFENPSIENLPDSITDLLNLETLIVSNCENLSTLPRELGKLVNLRFLDVSKNKFIEIPLLKKKKKNFIESLPDSITDLLNLQTLKLSGCSSLKALPRDLKKMVNLRFLDISGNESIESLPDSITDLLSLQTLKLSGCSSLTALPRDLKKLINLRHLLIDGCGSLTHMPCGLNHLSSLQTLSRFVVQKMDRRVPGGVGRVDELGGLNKLAGSISLVNLDFVQPAPNKAHLREKERLRSLELRWWVPPEERDEKSEGDELTVWDNLTPHENLARLTISGYGGRNPPSWLSSITCLVTLSLFHCGRWKYLPPLSELPSLRELGLAGLGGLEFVEEIRDPQQSNTARPFFPSLERLGLSHCHKLRGWWGRSLLVGEEQDHGRYDSRSSFPKLSRVHIRCCDNLKALPLLPSVLELWLEKSSAKWLEQQVTAVPNYSSEAALVSTSIPLSKLKTMSFEAVLDLDHSMLETVLPFLRNLESMSFSRCSALRGLSSGMQYLSSLQHLYVVSCGELDLSTHDDEHGTQWRSLANLRTLKIEGLPKLVALPEGIQYVTTLQSLSIRSCKNLTSLPEWIGNLSSLQDLEIFRCPGIECLPDGMRGLTSLTSLKIVRCPF